MNTNRVMEGCECIFMPESKAWSDKLRPKSGSSLGSRSRSNVDILDEPQLPPLLYDQFFEEVKGIEPSGNYYEQGQTQSDAFQRNDSDNSKSGDMVEVRVIYICSNPLKNKKTILKIFRDRNQNILLAKSISNKRGPVFLVDAPHHQPTNNNYKDQQKLEGRCGLFEFVKWSKDKKYPTALLLSVPNKELELELERMLLTYDYELPLELHSKDIQQRVKEDKLSHNLFQPVNIEAESKRRRDYTNRFVVAIESDYFENKEINFSIQRVDESSSTFTIYVPDIDHYIKLGSLVDLESRKRKTTFNLPYCEYPMLPGFVNDVVSFKAGEAKLAIAISLVLNHKDGFALEPDQLPTVEKCIIRSRIKLTYEDCEIITKNGENFEGIPNQLSQKLELIKDLHKDKTDADRASLGDLLKQLTGVSEAFREELAMACPLEQLLVKDFIERETNSKLTRLVSRDDQMYMSNVVFDVELMVSKAVARLLRKEMPKFAVFKTFEQPSKSSLEKLAQALELVDLSGLVSPSLDNSAHSYTELAKEISSLKSEHKRKVDWADAVLHDGCLLRLP